MEKIFDIISTYDVYIETHIPNRHGERVSSTSDQFCLEEGIPYRLSEYVRFLDYLRDGDGKITGAKFLCDLGGGYYAPREKEEIEAYPGDEVKFFHNWTGVDDDGCPEDNSTFVKFRLEWHKEQA